MFLTFWPPSPNTIRKLTSGPGWFWPWAFTETAGPDTQIFWSVCHSCQAFLLQPATGRILLLGGWGREIGGGSERKDVYSLRQCSCLFSLNGLGGGSGRESSVSMHNHRNLSNPHHSNPDALPPGNSPVCVSGPCCSQRKNKYAHFTNTHCKPSPTQYNCGTLRKYQNHQSPF